MKSRFIIIIALILFFVSIIRSEEITLQEAIDLALKNNKEIKSSRADYKSGLWQKYYAITTSLPTASFTARATHFLNNSVQTVPGMQTFENSGNYSLNFSQPIFMGGQIITAYKMASTTEKLKKVALKDKINQIKSEIISKYNNAVKEQMLVNIQMEQLKLAKHNFAIAIQRYSAGLISKTDLLQIELNKKNMEINLLGAKTRQKLALEALNNAIGSGKKYTVATNQKINYKIYSSIVDSLLQYRQVPNFILTRCGKSNSKINISQKSLRLSLLSHKLSYASFLPTVSLFYGKSWQNYWNDVESFKNSDFTDNASYGINFSIPLFPIINNLANYKKSLWNYKKIKFDTEKSIEDIKTLLKSSYWQFLTFYKQVESNKLALGYAEDMYKISQEKYDNSLISSNELLIAEISYQTAQVNYVNAIYRFLNEKNNLKNILGIDSDTHFINFLKSGVKK